jgi:hypothetical protein
MSVEGPTRSEQKLERYQAKADECEKLASLLSYGPAKQEMLEMAKQWRHLARQAERRGS